jgi:hypothetical protein
MLILQPIEEQTLTRKMNIFQQPTMSFQFFPVDLKELATMAIKNA